MADLTYFEITEIKDHVEIRKYVNNIFDENVITEEFVNFFNDEFENGINYARYDVSFCTKDLFFMMMMVCMFFMMF